MSKILHRAELTFWDVFIRLLSNSQSLRALLRVICCENLLTYRLFWIWTGMVLAGSVVVGLFGGYMLYFLTYILK